MTYDHVFVQGGWNMQYDHVFVEGCCGVARFLSSAQNLVEHSSWGRRAWRHPLPNDGGDLYYPNMSVLTMATTMSMMTMMMLMLMMERTPGGSLPASWTSGMRRRDSVSGQGIAISVCAEIVIFGKILLFFLFFMFTLIQIDPDPRWKVGGSSSCILFASHGWPHWFCQVKAITII